MLNFGRFDKIKCHVLCKPFTRLHVQNSMSADIFWVLGQRKIQNAHKNSWIQPINRYRFLDLASRVYALGQKTHARRRGIERGGAKTERGGRGRFLSGY